MKATPVRSALLRHVQRIGLPAAVAVAATISHSSIAATKPGENSVAKRPSGDMGHQPHPSHPGMIHGNEHRRPTGEELFSRPFQDSNGRSCATCHVPKDSFTLTPRHVAQLLEKNPNDPLFNAIDADDPTAQPLTFEHLKKGLIRVGLKLPENMDQIDGDGNVITPADRTIFVWRGVPSIADSALTAPYQLDGREATLESQAQGAITGHSQGGKARASELKRIADFERGAFTSDRSRLVARMLEHGVPFDAVPDVEARQPLSPAEARGRVVYNAVCASCHGGANKAAITDRVVHGMAFPALKPNGTVLFQVPATEPPTPLLAAQPENGFINIGSALENYLAQMGATEHESFTKDVSFPQYRFRFYKDASRSEVVADLPPALPRDPNDPENPFSIVNDDDGNPIVGPNFSPQFYTTDPGRAIITGNPYDFEAFDIPTLRGIAKTAPYWHNNISATLEDVVELYSDHLLSKFPTLMQPGEKESDPDGEPGPEQTMTRQQKDDLVKYLKRL